MSSELTVCVRISMITVREFLKKLISETLQVYYFREFIYPPPFTESLFLGSINELHVVYKQIDFLGKENDRSPLSKEA